MSRPLRRVPAGPDVLDALRDALAGGPAVFVDAGAASDLPDTVEQRVALVVETSGSTGTPKRVMLSADAVLASAAASESALGGPGQWVQALPTHYIAGINVLARSIAAGVDPVTVDGHFDPATFIEAAGAVTERVRFTALVPAQLSTLLADDDATAALRGFDRVLIGGQALPRQVRVAAESAGIRITRTYGSSETCGGCVYDGEPIGQAAVRIEDDEVWLGGPTLAEGYLGDEPLTADRFVVADGQHWFRTSDTGTWDGERLAVTGRRDDVIISGGVKVSLAAVESVLRRRAWQAEFAVTRKPDARWGEVPVIVSAGDDDFTEEIDAVGRVLGPPARPAVVIRVTSLPLLPSGKPDLLALEALAARAAD